MLLPAWARRLPDGADGHRLPARGLHSSRRRRAAGSRQRVWPHVTGKEAGDGATAGERRDPGSEG